jgi:hypothetical protein
MMSIQSTVSKTAKGSFVIPASPFLESIRHLFKTQISTYIPQKKQIYHISHWFEGRYRIALLLLLILHSLIQTSYCIAQLLILVCEGI